jgi:hypothetical protein
MDLTERFNHLAKLKEQARLSQAAADLDKKEMKEFEQDLYALAQSKGCFGQRTTHGQFSLKATEYGTITDLEAFVEWAKEQDLEAEFLKVEEQAARVNELVRNALDTGTPLPPGVGFYTRQYISVTTPKED